MRAVGLAVEARIVMVTPALAAALAEAAELLEEADEERGRSRPEEVAASLLEVRRWAQMDAVERVGAALEQPGAEIGRKSAEVLVTTGGSGATIDWMTASDVAAVVDLTPRRVRQEAIAGNLVGERREAVGKRTAVWRFRPEAVSEFVAARS